MRKNRRIGGGDDWGGPLRRSEKIFLGTAGFIAVGYITMGVILGDALSDQKKANLRLHSRIRALEKDVTKAISAQGEVTVKFICVKHDPTRQAAARIGGVPVLPAVFADADAGAK